MKIKKILLDRNLLYSSLTVLTIFFGTLGGLGKYGFMDDYHILESSISDKFNLDHYLSQGRPISGFFSQFIFSLIDTIDELLYLHILGSVTLCLLGLSCFFYYKKFSLKLPLIYLLSSIPILLSPGLLLVTAWAVMSSIIVSIAPAIAASFLILTDGIKHKKLFASILVSFSFLSYPPSALIFIGLPTIAYFLIRIEGNEANLPPFLKSALRDSYYITFLSGVFSLTIIKCMAFFFPSDSNRTDLVGPIQAKFDFLIKGAIPTVFDFLSPEWGLSIFGMVVILIIMFTPILFSRKNVKSNLIVLFLVLVSVFTPSILTAENWPTNRSLYPGQWVVSSLTLISLARVCFVVAKKLNTVRYFPILFVLLVSMVIMSSNQLLISTMRDPQLKELQAARTEIQRLNPSEAIEVKASIWPDSIAPWNFSDEFGIPSTCQPWVPIPFTKLILLENYPRIVPSITLVNKLSTQNSIDFSTVLSSSRN